MVLVKNWKFFERFVLCKINPEKVFGDVLVRKQAFLNNENVGLKTHKIGIFPKLAFLSKIDREKEFADVLDKKEAFKDYKNNGL